MHCSQVKGLNKDNFCIQGLSVVTFLLATSFTINPQCPDCDNSPLTHIFGGKREFWGDDSLCVPSRNHGTELGSVTNCSNHGVAAYILQFLRGEVWLQIHNRSVHLYYRYISEFVLTHYLVFQDNGFTKTCTLSTCLNTCVFS